MLSKRKAPVCSGTPSKKSGNVLTLSDKMRVIEAVDGGMSNRAMALKLNCGRTQVNTIMLQCDAIQSAYKDGMNASKKYLALRHMSYPEIDSETWVFFCEACDKNIPVNGPLLQSQASDIAMKYNYDKFSASNGWLESFCDRHQIKMANLHGESAEVSDEAV